MKSLVSLLVLATFLSSSSLLAHRCPDKVLLKAALQERNFNAAQFAHFFGDSSGSTRSRAVFDYLSKGHTRRLGIGGSFYALVPIGSTVVADLFVGGFGEGRAILGTLKKVTPDRLHIQVDSKLVKINSGDGYDGLNRLAVLPDARPGVNQYYPSCLNSAERAEELAQGGKWIATVRDQLKLVPLESRILVSRIEEEQLGSTLIRGHLVRVGNEYMTVRANGTEYEVMMVEGAKGGFDQLAVLP